MNDIKAIIRELFNERGYELIKNPSVFCAMIDDLVQEHEKERKILRKLLTRNNEICVKLYSLISTSDREKKELVIFRDCLENDFGLSDSWIDFIFDVFELSDTSRDADFENRQTVEDTAAKYPAAKIPSENKKNTDSFPLVDIYLDGQKIKYAGEMRSGVPDGCGKAIWGNGSIYEGSWSDGRRTGKGKFTWADGASYDGDWLDNKRTGK